MDFKEKFSELAFVGIITFVATWAVKHFNKTIVPLKKLFKHSDEIDKLKADAKKYQFELQKTEMLLYAYMDVDPIATFVMQPDGQLKFVNNAYLDITGFTKKENAYGKGWLQAVHEDDYDDVYENAQMLEKNPSNWEKTFRFRHVKNKSVCITTCITNIVTNPVTGEVMKTLGRLYVQKT